MCHVSYFCGVEIVIGPLTTDQFDKATQEAFQRSWNKNRKTEFLALL